MVTVLSHRYNSRTGSGETKVESHASSETQPNQAALLLNTARIQPGSQLHQCVGRNTVHLATWLACTAPGPPQESLVHNETRISLPAKPPLTRMTKGSCASLHGPPGRGRLRQSLGANPESLVAQLALHCSALDHCTTREAQIKNFLRGLKISVQLHPPSNLIELERICREELEKLPKYRCAKLVVSYQRRR